MTLYYCRVCRNYYYADAPCEQHNSIWHIGCNNINRCCASKICGWVVIALFVGALIALPIGIGLLVGSNNGKFPDTYRSGYVCGLQPPSVEDYIARGNISTCINMQSSKWRSGITNNCLQAGNLDKPAVWCNQQYKPNEYVWWSPCNKCGTAWRVYNAQDNDKSWFKRPTSSQPNVSAMPEEDGWLAWDRYDEKWRETTMTISSCSSSDGYYYEDEGTANNFTLSSSSTGSNNEYNIPSACYSDEILVKTNKAYSASLPLIIIGSIAWCGFLQALIPERFRGDSGGYNGGGGGE